MHGRAGLPPHGAQSSTRLNEKRHLSNDTFAGPGMENVAGRSMASCLLDLQACGPTCGWSGLKLCGFRALGHTEVESGMPGHMGGMGVLTQNGQVIVG